MIEWCQTTTLFSTSSETKELIVDWKRKAKDPQTILHPRANSGESQQLQVPGCAYLGSFVHQCCFLRRQRRFGMSANSLLNFYWCTVENILTSCIMTWFDKSNTQECRRLQNVVKTVTLISCFMYFVFL